jgi:Protein of unknown function (DUF2971)
MPQAVLEGWAKLLEDEPERVQDVPVLYHYTDAVGFHGIVSSHTLWATAAQFSNDLTEIEYALGTAREVINEVWKSKTKLGDWEQLLRHHVEGFFASPFPDYNEPFLVSFCEDGDLLSQWRAYGHRSGFSLGFKLHDDGLGSVRCEKGLRTLLRKVVYDSVHQKARLHFLLRNFIKLVNDLPDTPSADAEHGHNLDAELSLLLILEMTEWASTVKHTAFSEEREWRLISFPGFRKASANLAEVKIRANSELLIPYMVLKARKGTHLPLVNVRCGPSPLQKESTRAVTMLLAKEGYNSLPIASSEIPLRV